MIKKFLGQQKHMSFSSIRNTIFFYFFLACLFTTFLVLGLVAFLGQEESNAIATSLKYYTALSIFFFAIILFVFYKFLAKPMVEIVRTNSKEQYRQIQQSKSILENTSVMIWAVDTNYRLLECNSLFIKMMDKKTGTPPVIGENILEKEYSNLSFSDRKKLYKKALSGESFETEIEDTSNGLTRHHELSFHPLYDKNNFITGCSIFRKDITQRHETLEELQKSEEFLKEAQDIANVGHWNWDMTKDEIQWSDQLFKVFGLDPETFEANYEGLMNIVHPEDQQTFGNSIENCLTNQEPHDIMHRIILQDGSIRHVHQKGKAYYEDGDTPARMAGTIQDVTELENGRLQIMRQYNELQNFVYIVSHNVRAPISTLQSLVAIIETGNETLNAEIIPSIGATIDTLDQTIKDLNHALSLKDITKDAFEEINLRKVLKDIERLIALDIGTSGAEIEYDLSKAPKAIGLRGYFTNILFNLILNSILYKADNRPLHITVASKISLLGELEIMVSDNGKGMNLNTERRKRIFDMYGRLSGASKGRGMGLYLAKNQVEAMNGVIEVESELNKGTIFKLIFQNMSTAV